MQQLEMTDIPVPLIPNRLADIERWFYSLSEIIIRFTHQCGAPEDFVIDDLYNVMCETFTSNWASVPLTTRSSHSIMIMVPKAGTTSFSSHIRALSA